MDTNMIIPVVEVQQHSNTLVLFVLVSTDTTGLCDRSQSSLSIWAYQAFQGERDPLLDIAAIEKSLGCMGLEIVCG
jgi:hypothetical protein